MSKFSNKISKLFTVMDVFFGNFSNISHFYSSVFKIYKCILKLLYFNSYRGGCIICTNIPTFFCSREHFQYKFSCISGTMQDFSFLNICIQSSTNGGRQKHYHSVYYLVL